MSQHHQGSSTNFRSSAYSSRRGPSSDYQPLTRQYSADYSKYQSQRFPNQRHLIQPTSPPPEETNPNKLPTRRQNYVINNLRSQLQNIKSQVAKLIHHDSPMKNRFNEESSLAGGGSPRSKEQSQAGKERMGYAGGRLQRYAGDNSSTSSFMLSREKPRVRVTTEGLDRERYHELENEIIKSELKNLKNKYVMRKNEWKEERETQEKKILLLEGVISHNQQQMAQYKVEIENEIINIREDMAGRVHMAAQQPHLHSSNPRINILQSQNNQLKQQISYLRKRTSEANDEIKKMAIECNDLKHELKKSQSNTNLAQELKQKESQYEMQKQQILTQTRTAQQNIKNEYSYRIQQLQGLVFEREEYIKQILEKQSIANEIVMKNAELIEALNRERVKSSRLESELGRTAVMFGQSGEGGSQLELVSMVESTSGCSSSQFSELQGNMNNVVMECRMLREQKGSLEKDLMELSHLMNNLKMDNQELRTALQNSVTPTPEPPLSQSNISPNNFEQLHSLRTRNQTLQSQASHIKGYISGMITQTAQKMNEIEVQNEILKDKIITLEKQNRGLRSGRCNADEGPTLMERINSKEDVAAKSLRRVEELESWKITLEQTIEAKEREIESLKYQLRKFGEVLMDGRKEVDDFRSEYDKQFEKELAKQSSANLTIDSLNTQIAELTAHYSKTIDGLKHQIIIISNSQSPSEEISSLRQHLNSNLKETENLRKNCIAYESIIATLKTQLQTSRTTLAQEITAIQNPLKQEIHHLQEERSLASKTTNSLYLKVESLSEELRRKDEFLSRFVGENFDQSDKERMQEMIEEFKKVYEVENIRSSLKSEMLEIRKLTDYNNRLVSDVVKLEEKVRLSGGAVTVSSKRLIDE